MDGSPLGRLPPELRNYIYELVLQVSKPIHVRCTDLNNTRGFGASIAFTTTCRAIRSESLGIFYAVNTFTLHTTYMPEIKKWGTKSGDRLLNNSILAWTSAIGSENCKSAKGIVIDKS
ncbi:hypothetical protein LTR86_008600 [Recurvomyces mirabilis]|nr:hypothetical protein LTR86_008600 [Recurvomyces mirabilis]